MYFSLIFISFTPPCIPFSDGLLCIFPNRSISVSVYSPFHRQWIVKYVRNLKSVYTHSATINKHLNTQSRCEQREHTHTQKHAIKSWMHNRVSPCPTSPLVRFCIGDQFDAMCVCPPARLCLLLCVCFYLCVAVVVVVYMPTQSIIRPIDVMCAPAHRHTHTHRHAHDLVECTQSAWCVCVCGMQCDDGIAIN